MVGLTKLRQGLVRNELRPPFIMGLECSGLVVNIGCKVEDFKKGDKVIVHTGKPGLQTEFVCVETSCCFRMPESMTWEEAAAFPVNYLTASFCLFDIGNLRTSQTVLIPSAAGGVGWAATQLAKSVPNVRVIGLAGSCKHEAVSKNGVDVIIDSSNPQWEEAVRAACPEGVDIALDFISGDNFRRTQLLVKDLGRAILIGANDVIAGETLNFWRLVRSWWYTATVKPVDLVLNSRIVAGFHLTNVKNRLPLRYRDTLLHLLELYNKNVIRPRIDSVWTFQQIIEATNRLAHRENIGKVILST